MASINPYLNFNGNAEAAFNFYKTVFGGEFLVVQRFGDVPEIGNVPENEKNRIMHISLPLTNKSVLMGCDTVSTFGPAVVSGSNVTLSITSESEVEADQLFLRLASSGKITMPMQKTFWGSYFGMLTDQFSIQWMISYEYSN